MATKKKRATKKQRATRGLYGTPSEHLQHAIYRLRTAKKILTCGEVGPELFEAGTIVAHASESGNRKLFAMAARRRDMLLTKYRACIRG